MEIIETKWLDFVEQETKGSTRVFNVVSKNEDMLGTIKWFPRWRKFAFFPEKETVFEQECLNDIAKFVGNLMAERKAKQVSEMRNIKGFERFR